MIAFLFIDNYVLWTVIGACGILGICFFVYRKFLKNSEELNISVVYVLWFLTLLIFLTTAWLAAIHSLDNLASGLIGAMGGVLGSYFFIAPIEIHRYKKILNFKKKQHAYEFLLSFSETEMRLVSNIATELQENTTENEESKNKIPYQNIQIVIDKIQENMKRIYVSRLYLPRTMLPIWGELIHIPTCEKFQTFQKNPTEKTFQELLDYISYVFNTIVDMMRKDLDIE